MTAKEIFEEIIHHAWAEFPNEACGVLAARDGKVEKIYRMSNIEKSPVGFSMDLKEQFSMAREMRSLGLDTTAIYHSHPNAPAYPSKRDIRLARDPSIVYIIISLRDGAHCVASFKIVNGEVIANPDRISEFSQ